MFFPSLDSTLFVLEETGAMSQLGAGFGEGVTGLEGVTRMARVCGETSHSRIGSGKCKVSSECEV